MNFLTHGDVCKPEKRKYRQVDYGYKFSYLEMV